MHLGLDRVIAAWERDGALIDPGPESTVERVLAELGGEPRAILLTHIHLDHAGATGALVRRFPSLRVYVHESGAPHLIDPSKLLRSAGRLYGGEMERLWGEVVPVPDANIVALSGGEEVEGMEVLYAPGHAGHHVVYFDGDSGDAFVGDVGGVLIPPGDEVWMPTPPPDIDLEAWRKSEERILAWEPDTLFLTHFGPYNGARMHFQELMNHIAEWSRIVRRLLADESVDEERRQQKFVDEALLQLKRAVGEQEAEKYSRAGRIDYSWQGLSRYWRKQNE